MSEEPRDLYVSQGSLAPLVSSGAVVVERNDAVRMSRKVAMCRGCHREASASLRGLRGTSVLWCVLGLLDRVVWPSALILMCFCVFS